MATTAQLKTRVILLTNRDDMGSGGALEQELTDAIADTIEEHADEQFWFNRISGTKATVASTATVAVPSGMRLATDVVYLGRQLEKVSLGEIQFKTETGIPSHWAENEGAIQLWPIPDAIYTLYVYGIEELGVPASSASNAWTTTAYELTLNGVIRRLALSFRDPELAAWAALNEEKALTKLRRETRKRSRRPMTTDFPPGRPAFNINIG